MSIRSYEDHSEKQQDKKVCFREEEQSEKTPERSIDGRNVMSGLEEVRTGRGSAGLVREREDRCRTDETGGSGNGTGKLYKPFWLKPAFLSQDGHCFSVVRQVFFAPCMTFHGSQGMDGDGHSEWLGAGSAGAPPSICEVAQSCRPYRTRSTSGNPTTKEMAPGEHTAFDGSAAFQPRRIGREGQEACGTAPSGHPTLGFNRPSPHCPRGRVEEDQW